MVKRRLISALAIALLITSGVGIVLLWRATGVATWPTTGGGPGWVRVLVVDDEPMVGNAVARTLSAEHDVLVVPSARAALEVLRRGDRDRRRDLRSHDAGDAGMDLHAELDRATPELRDRMIFLTGGAFTPVAEEFLLRVPNLRLEKPFEAATLRGMVHQLVADPR